LALTPFARELSERYVLFLLGFVNHYVMSVQYGSITFPRNRGGIYKIAADVAWLTLTGSLIYLFARHGDLGDILPIYKLGFLLFLTFQFFPLITYRLRTVKRRYDVVAASFMMAGAVWGTLSALVSGKPFLHMVFLGFQMNTFLGCMYFMLPRFSRRVYEDISLALAAVIFALLQSALIFNFWGFSAQYTLLRVAVILLGSALPLFLWQMRRFIFNYPVALAVLWFSWGLYHAWYYERSSHIPLMALGMGSFAFGMGWKWYMLNFGRGNSEYDILYQGAYISLVLGWLMWHGFLGLSAALLILWVFLNARKVKTLPDELVKSFLNWWR